MTRDEAYQKALDYYKGDDLAARVLIGKYCINDGENWYEATWDDVAGRVAKSINHKYGSEEDYLWLLKNKYFIPGGRGLFAIGNPYNKASIANCYYIPITEDSIEGIFEAAKRAARTYSYGGGVGLTLDLLRPKGSPTANAAKASTGVVPFMELFSKTTGIIGMEGRRGAELLAINVAHPDVEDVIEAKRKGHDIKFANVSVIVTDKFMKALENDEEWNLWYPDLVRDYEFNDEMEKDLLNFYHRFMGIFFNNFCKKCNYNKDVKILYDEWMELQGNYKVNIIPVGWYSPYYLNRYDDYVFICEGGRLEYRRKKVYKTVKARDLWRKIAESAWESAEPGVLFFDTTKKRTAHTEVMFMEIGGTNACSEQPLPNYGNCNLGNMNLSAIVKDKQIDYTLLSKIVDLSVRFLNDMLDYGLELHPLPQQKLVSYLIRKIGLGFTGLADMFLKLGVRYGSKESVEIAHSIMRAIRKQAFTTSIQLAKEFGAFPLYDKGTFKSEYIDEVLEDLDDEVKKDFEEYGIYNSNLLTVPPVGSGSIILQTSTGMEPVFAWRYTKKTESVAAGEHHVYHPYLKQYLEENNLTYEEWERNKEDYCITAHEIDYKDRVKLQGVITHYLDSSLSSTVNLPEETTVEDIEDLYRLAYKCGCKGITIYRDGCSLGSILKKEERTPQQIINDYLMQSVRYKVSTPTNSLHVFINYDKDKKPLEVFISHGKAGSDEKADHEALGRVLSKALQYGCPPEEIVDTLTDITGQQVWFYKGRMYKSIPDAIGKILGDFVGKTTEAPTKKKCPVCGEYEVEKEGGCEICKSCGWSKCG